MIHSSIGDGGGLDRIMGRLARYRDIDLSSLATTIGQIVEDDTRAGIAAGTDTDGSSFAPLAESTLQRRKGRDDTPGGGAGGSLARDLDITIKPDGDRFAVVVGWAGSTAAKARYFTHGNSHQPARNIQGLRPESRERIRAAVRDFMAQIGRSN